MKIEGRIFIVLTVYFFAVAALYGWWTGHDSTIEWAGLAALVLSGGLLGIIGTYLQFIARRIEPRPEDRSDAEISDGAGDLGFFSPGSYWPLGIAMSASVVAYGLAFRQWWMVVVGVALILATVSGLLFEYYVGQRKSLR
jgi:hypothetical protein